MVNISDAVNASFEILKDYVPDAYHESKLIVGFVIKKDSVFISVHKEKEISKHDFQEIISMSERRRSKEPLGYIFNKKEFMSLDFYVDKNVLIPRPETELIVESVMDFASDKKLKILDICTGSGAICVSLAYYLKNAICTGTDISKEALEIAKKNSDTHNVQNRCNFILCDALKKMPLKKEYDIIVSNPPYIETSVIDNLDDTVKNFEPRIALDGGYDGLDFYKSIIDFSDLYLKKDGILVFEIGYNEGNAVKKMMMQKFKNVTTKKDYASLDRMVSGQLR